MTNVDLLTHERSGPSLSVERESLNMSRFLNRLLGLPVDLQNSVFSYFADTLVAIIVDAKRLGRWDGGIMDFGATGEQVEVVESREFVGDPAFGTATTELHKVSSGGGGGGGGGGEGEGGGRGGGGGGGRGGEGEEKEEEEEKEGEEKEEE